MLVIITYYRWQLSIHIREREGKGRNGMGRGGEWSGGKKERGKKVKKVGESKERKGKNMAE